MLQVTIVRYVPSPAMKMEVEGTYGCTDDWVDPSIPIVAQGVNGALDSEEMK